MIPKFVKKTSKKPGLPPGSIVHVGRRREAVPRIAVIRYNAEAIGEETVDGRLVSSAQDPLAPAPSDGAGAAGVTWINIDGIHDPALLEAVGRRFAIHPLTLEDVAHAGQRPKLEDYGDYLYLVAKMLYFDAGDEAVHAEQVSFILTRGALLSFQETPVDVFDPVRERLRGGKGRIRGAGADYLLYALLDAMVDHYFPILEVFGDRLALLDEALVTDLERKTLDAIHEMIREMLFLRRQIAPLRDALGQMKDAENPLVDAGTGLYLGDVHDHATQVLDTIANFRDLLAGMLDRYLSLMSNRMNEVMKMLTMIATIFIPMTFLTSVYGMNFKHMPELDWRWGYFGLWGVLIALAALMLLYFKRKDWL